MQFLRKTHFTERSSTWRRKLSSGMLAGIAFFPLELLCMEQTPAPIQTSNRFEVIDTPRDYLSGKFVNFVSSIDQFFGDSRNFQETNNSVMQLNFTKVSGYTGSPKYVLSGRAKLHLPTVQKRLHLLVETNPDKNITGESAQSQTVLSDQVAAPESYAAALRFENMAKGLWHFSSDAGVQLRGITTNPFARARGSYSVTLDQWRLKFAETLFWFHTIGAGESTQLDFERVLSDPFLFRSTSNATWLNEKQNFDLRQDFSLYHTLSARTALLYQGSVIGVSHPQSHVTNYVLLMTYRYRLHRDWVFFELSPQLHFPRVKNYQTSPMMVMRLEMLFDGSK